MVIEFFRCHYPASIFFVLFGLVFFLNSLQEHVTLHTTFHLCARTVIVCILQMSQHCLLTLTWKNQDPVLNLCIASCRHSHEVCTSPGNATLTRPVSSCSGGGVRIYNVHLQWELGRVGDSFVTCCLVAEIISCGFLLQENTSASVLYVGLPVYTARGIEKEVSSPNLSVLLVHSAPRVAWVQFNFHGRALYAKLLAVHRPQVWHDVFILCLRSQRTDQCYYTANLIWQALNKIQKLC